MIAVRKSLDFIFTKYELKALDDLMPDNKKHKEFDDEEEANLVNPTLQLKNDILTCQRISRVLSNKPRRMTTICGEFKEMMIQSPWFEKETFENFSKLSRNPKLIPVNLGRAQTLEKTRLRSEK